MDQPKILSRISSLCGRMPALIVSLVIIAIAIFFGYLNHWQIFEQDAFWLPRAGDEILANKTVQSTDSWSFTAKGLEWINFQWLSAILFSLVVKWGGAIESLVWLRSALTFIYFIVCGVLIWRWVERSTELDHKSRSPIIATLAVLLLLPIIYLIDWLRFQIRPDFLGIIFFAGVVGVFCEIREGLFLRARNLILVCAILIVWSNFHSGTVVLGIAYASLAILFGGRIQWAVRLGVVALFVACWFLTPQTWHVLKVISAATQISNNPDLQPFQLKNLAFGTSSFTYMLFWAYWILAVGIFVLHKRARKLLPEIYQSKMFFYSGLALFTWLFLDRQRTVPYITFFLLPVVTCGFVALTAESLRVLTTTWQELMQYEFYVKKLQWPHYRAWIIYFSAIILLWFFMLPVQKKLNVAIGRSVSPLFMPVKCVEFISYARPNLNIYNHFNFGGYLIYMLRDYPVYYDGRETPFLKASVERDRAARKPSDFADFLGKYDINTVIETLPQGDMVKVYEEYYPNREWARVCTDLASTVYVRRVFDHQLLISRYESRGAEVQQITASAGETTPSDIEKPPKPTEAQVEQLLRDAREEIRRRGGN